MALFVDGPENDAAGGPAHPGRDSISAFADLGADEVVLYCWATDPTQLDRLADLTS